MKIYKADSALEAKTLSKLIYQRIGREAFTNYMNEWYPRRAQTIMHQIARVKFRVNRVAYTALLATAGRPLYEATQNLKWGIGLTLEKVFKKSRKYEEIHRDTFPGTNWMGCVLENVRNELLAELLEDTKWPTIEAVVMYARQNQYLGRLEYRSNLAEDIEPSKIWDKFACPVPTVSENDAWHRPPEAYFNQRAFPDPPPPPTQAVYRPALEFWWGDDDDGLADRLRIAIGGD